MQRHRHESSAPIPRLPCDILEIFSIDDVRLLQPCEVADTASNKRLEYEDVPLHAKRGTRTEIRLKQLVCVFPAEEVRSAINGLVSVEVLEDIFNPAFLHLHDPIPESTDILELVGHIVQAPSVDAAVLDIIVAVIDFLKAPLRQPLLLHHSCLLVLLLAELPQVALVEDEVLEVVKGIRGDRLNLVALVVVLLHPVPETHASVIGLLALGHDDTIIILLIHEEAESIQEIVVFELGHLAFLGRIFLSLLGLGGQRPTIHDDPFASKN